ncbi:MAG: TIGR03435 family protein [Acidobacteriaceae bacterium]|jgi:uncharacterized protein (TIGR03435 family)
MRPIDHLGRFLSLLASASLALAVAAPVTYGFLGIVPIYGQVLHAPGPLPSFEVVVIKPSQDQPHGSDANGEEIHLLVNAKLLIQMAYGINGGGARPTDLQVLNGPDWTNTEVFDILAKTASATFTAMQTMSRAQRNQQRQLMEQSLLADRFQLKLHTETRDQPIYTLIVSKGLKLKPAQPDSSIPATVILSPGGTSLTPETLRKGILVRATPQGYEMTAKGVTLDTFVHALATYPELAGRAVVDQTNLPGAFDFTLTWSPDQRASTPNAPSPDAAASTDASASTPTGNEPLDVPAAPLFTAIQQQLGLKLTSAKGPAEVVIVDHIERPSEN